MIYNRIDKKKVTLGDPKQVFSDNKSLTPVYYDGGRLVFTERDRYMRITGIKTNSFGKRQILVKSKMFASIVEDLVNVLSKLSGETVTNPLTTDGSIMINLGKDSRIVHLESKAPCTEDLSNRLFEACVSIIVPTIFTDDSESKCTMQLVLEECIVVKILDSEIDIDLSRLQLAD